MKTILTVDDASTMRKLIASRWEARATRSSKPRMGRQRSPPLASPLSI